MTRLMIALAAMATAAASIAVLPAPAVAQQSAVAEIIVYGNDPCPRSTEDKVVVCARRPEAERYRIPPKLRPSGTRQQSQSWAQNAKSLETVGATGTNSCSPVGPGGSTGCLVKLINQTKQEQREETQAVTPPEQ